ncbi:MAG: IS30 family transposase [Bacteroidia bacterium]|nr:IS30 family transposase [Bacteroidia bacterium]
MDYRHLTTFERGRIEALNQLGYTVRQIGNQINRHHSTVARELARNNRLNYCSETAQAGYIQRRKSSKPKGKYCPDLVSIIEQGLEATWSPEQISNTITSGKLSFKTIYRWLYCGLLSKGNLKVLRHKGKRHKPAEKRGKFTVGKSIHSRPLEVKTRETFGHWELDTVVSSRGKSKGCFATFVERKTRLYTAIKIDDRTAASMESAIKQLHSVLPENSFKTATVDRGKEFACYVNIEKDINLPVFFADPYSSWQRGSNENSNGLIREFYPKKTDLACVDEKELISNLFLLNNRPRKCLGWKSPIQMFLHEVSHLT